MTMLSVRLDATAHQILDQLARRLRVSRSAAVRQAITALAQGNPSTDSPYDGVAHLLGCGSGGPRDLSKNTGAGFRSRLTKRHRRR